MARRNIFQPPPPPTDTPDARPRFPNTGAISGVRSTLKDLSTNAVREIDPALIDDAGPRDRLAFSDEDVAQLAASIREHGQQVPIMVRPAEGRPGHYRIVYGRRRLRALRLLNQPAKALVRSLSDEQAVLAQGQENAQRLDPSFIEKALFATELAEAGYDGAVIMDALAIDKPMLSRMSKVARSIPAAVIHVIGAAHGIGRRRWEELADLARDRQEELAATVEKMAPRLEPLASDDRFARVAETARAGLNTPARPALPVLHPDGTRIAELRDSPRSLTLRINKTDAPGFAQWLRDNAEDELIRLHDAWKAGVRDT